MLVLVEKEHNSFFVGSGNNWWYHSCIHFFGNKLNVIPRRTIEIFRYKSSSVWIPMYNCTVEIHNFITKRNFCLAWYPVYTTKNYINMQCYQEIHPCTYRRMVKNFPQTIYLILSFYLTYGFYHTWIAGTQ